MWIREIGLDELSLTNTHFYTQRNHVLYSVLVFINYKFVKEESKV